MGLLDFLGFGAREPQANTPAPQSRNNDTVAMRRIAAKLASFPPEQARYLAAFAYILGRVAHADSHFSEEETGKMQEIVQVLGHLPEAQAVLAVEIAKSEVRLFEGTENYLVTRQFKKIASPKQRMELLDCAFAVSAADQSITALEERQVRQISKELGMTHKDFIAARTAYLEHLEALKQLRQSREGSGC